MCPVFAGCPDGAYLGMGGGIVLGSNPVHSGRDNLSVACNHSAERTAAIGYIFFGKHDGFPHKFFTCHILVSFCWHDDKSAITIIIYISCLILLLALTGLISCPDF